MRPFIFLQTTNLHLHLTDQQRALLQTINTHIILINIFKPKHIRNRQPFSYEHNDEKLNFYNNRSTNAAAEFFNAKIKLSRTNLHGVTDKKFFLFRIAKLYGYPINFFCAKISLQQVAFGLVKDHFGGDKRWFLRIVLIM